MVEFSFNRFRYNSFEKQIARLEKIMDSLEKLETVGGLQMNDLTEEDKKNAQVAIKYLETARTILRKGDRVK